MISKSVELPASKSRTIKANIIINVVVPHLIHY
jgi:hypothetical protein